MSNTAAVSVDASAEVNTDAMRDTIDGYERLREQCYRATQRDNAAVMGTDAWLSTALNPSDIEIGVTGTGVRCFGSTYTSQTQGNEWFDFVIPFAALIEA